MGSIRKIGDVYYIEFYARGLLYSQIAGKDENQAKELLAEIELKISNGEALTVVREINLDLFFEKFLEFAQEQYAISSINRLKSAWKHFVEFLKSDFQHVTVLSQITPYIMESYKLKLTQGIKPKLVNFTLLLIRDILEYGIKMGFINDNPTLHLSFLDYKTPEPHMCKRSLLAKELLGKNIGILCAAKLMKISDVARVMFWAKFISQKREDVYN